MGLPSTTALSALRIHLPEYGPPNFGPSERQRKFHESQAFETFFGGAAGPGKSTALCADALTFCTKYPGHRAFFFRRTLVTLEQGTLPVITKQISPYLALPDYMKSPLKNGKPLTIRYNGSKHIFYLSNGSFIQFAYLNTQADLAKYSSIEMHWLGFDELTQFMEDEYMFLLTRVRSDTDRPLRVRSASNPGDIGHNWVKERFIKSIDPHTKYVPEVPFEQVYEDPETGENYSRSRVFIPAFVSDNPNLHIQVEYRRNLNAIKDPQLRQALLNGDWDQFAGMIYSEWDPELHVIKGKLPFDLSTCQRFIGFDWGYKDPAVATWIALTPPNEYGVRHYYAYREIHETHRSPRWWAKTIADIIRDEPVEYMILPHDCFNHIGSTAEQTIADTFGDADIPYVRANSLSHAAKMHRIALLHDMLAISDDGLPQLQFHEFCANNVATIPTLPYSKTRPEEIDEKADDHDFDSTTYALMVIDDPEAYIVNSDGSDKVPRYNQNSGLGRAITDSSRRFSNRSGSTVIGG